MELEEDDMELVAALLLLLFWFKLFEELLDRLSQGTVLLLDGEEDEDDDEEEDTEFWLFILLDELPTLLAVAKLLLLFEDDATEVELTAAVSKGADEEAESKVIDELLFPLVIWLFADWDWDEGATVTTFWVDPPWKTVVIMSWLPACTILVGNELFPVLLLVLLLLWRLVPLVTLLLFWITPGLDEMVVSMLFDWLLPFVENVPSEVRVVIFWLLLLTDDDEEFVVIRFGMFNWVVCWLDIIWVCRPRLLFTSPEGSSIVHDIFKIVFFSLNWLQEK